MIAPDNAQHHAVNAAAVAAPVISWLSHAPEFFTVATGALASIWYLILIVEKVLAWKAKRKADRAMVSRVEKAVGETQAKQ